MFSMQCRKKRINIDNFVNISIYIYIYKYAYIYIYTNMPALYVIIIIQNENDSIKSILQHGRAVDKNCCVVFPTSGFPYLILCPRQSIRAKNN